MATKQAAQTSQSPLLKAIAFLDKNKVESHVVNLDPAMQMVSAPHIPTGSIVLDYLIGGRPNKHGVPPCPGIPAGRVTNLYGREASGKTTLALQICAQAIAAGGTACYIDWEHEVEISYAEKLGVPVYDNTKFIYVQPETLEDGFQYIVAMAMHGVSVIVLDSVGAAMPRIQAEVSIDEEGKDLRMGILAARWSTFFPKMKRIIAKTNTAIVGISQLREKIGGMGGYGDQYTVVGGNSWKFYPSVRIYLRPAGQEKSKIHNPITNQMVEMTTGMKVKARLDKCKVSDSAQHEMELYMRSGTGVDDLRSMIEMALAYKVMKKGGAFYTWTLPDGTEIKGQGLEKFRESVIKVPKYMEVLMAQLQPKWNAHVVQESTFVDEDDLSDFDEPDEGVDAESLLKEFSK